MRIIDKREAATITRLTDGPKHHLFGFHDLIISNSADSKYLCLEVDEINRPPLPGEQSGVGYIEDGHFVKLGETSAFNYPQGARQQWVVNSDFFTVNNRIGNVWGADLYDASINKLIDRFPATVHMLSRDGRFAYGLDYARLHRMGGYGYIGLDDKESNNPIPSNTGISVMDLGTKIVRTLVSVQDVVECGLSHISNHTHHYLTHLCLNPSGDRLAFLHRYFMPDGGLMTRLMTIGADGNGLRCLGQGFLSHFDWKDDNYIYIFGRIGSSVDSLRNNPILLNPLIQNSLRLTKKIVKALIGKNKGIGGSMSFLMIEDQPQAISNAFAKEIIPTDGHPMTNPINRDWFACDNYPDKEGFRDLFLYSFKQELRVDIGRFQRLFVKPDMRLKTAFFSGIDMRIVKTISEDELAFTRSGLHCDLHPRWNANGKFVVFDSIHEGTRQIYKVDVSSLIE